MSASKYIGVDLGASSGRIMLGEIDKTLRFYEIHRFPNPTILCLGHYYWDLLGLFHQLKQGLSKAVSMGHREVFGIGVDTWGVDFGFIGKGNVILGNPYCYRDERTKGMLLKVFAKISKSDLYKLTGIQLMELNSIYQLLSMVEAQHPVLETAETLLFMPDLFHFMLSGVKKSEYTIASTSQLLNVHTRQWETILFERFGLPRYLMPEIVSPGTILGPFSREIQDGTGLKAKHVIAPASHDTASAVAAVPAVKEQSWAYLSSGTWSLLGVERKEPLLNGETLERNFTNEGGVNGTIRFLKNLTGMWLLEGCRKKWGERDVSYEALIQEAERTPAFRSLIFPDDPLFLNPPDMLIAIQEFCRCTNQPIPETRGQFVRCIFESLALRYRQVIEEINRLIDQKINVLHVVGGGSQNAFLNQCTANACGIPVIAGPAEATAIGNVLMQAIATGELDSIAEGRKLVSNSFKLITFSPRSQDEWDEAFTRFSFFSGSPWYKKDVEI